mmetsp:Transcript_25546/g.43520  ORF Transcript_25546/g.43520 Transcript_25546/m.43520 type:complete len:224 (-) Transcript_25546:1373-2044(-)
MQTDTQLTALKVHHRDGPRVWGGGVPRDPLGMARHGPHVGGILRPGVGDFGGVDLGVRLSVAQRGWILRCRGGPGPGVGDVAKVLAKRDLLELVLAQNHVLRDAAIGLLAHQATPRIRCVRAVGVKRRAFWREIAIVGSGVPRGVVSLGRASLDEPGGHFDLVPVVIVHHHHRLIKPWAPRAGQIFGITVHGQDGLLSTGSAKLRSLGVHQTQIWGGLVVARV